MNRITPGLPVADMKTYGIRAPLATHWRKASCVEVECEGHRTGWLTVIVEGTVPPAEGASVRKMMALADRDEAEGLGDAPWPPNFAKQRGEPKRVQPSRSRPDTTGKSAG